MPCWTFLSFLSFFKYFIFSHFSFILLYIWLFWILIVFPHFLFLLILIYESFSVTFIWNIKDRSWRSSAGAHFSIYCYLLCIFTFCHLRMIKSCFVANKVLIELKKHKKKKKQNKQTNKSTEINWSWTQTVSYNKDNKT